MQVGASSTRPPVLFLPKWYPSRQDQQLGVFIRKHAVAVAAFIPVVVLSLHGDSSLKDKEIEDSWEGGLREVRVYYPVRKKGWWRRSPNLFRYLRAFFSGLSHIRESTPGFSLVHAHVILRPLVMAWFLHLRKGMPVLLTEHWTGYIHGEYRKKNLLYRMLSRRLVGKAAALTVVSENLRNAMLRYGLTNKQVVLIPNVVDVAGQVPPRSTEGRLPVRILTVADFVERNKNISGAIRVIARIRQSFPRLEYHLVGDGPDDQLVRERAREADPDGEWIIFHGRLPNPKVLEILAGMDFVLTNSLIETFSVITAEAIAMGKPVVATRSGGPEYFVDASNGILIAPGDDRELEQAVMRMLRIYRSFDPQVIAGGIRKKFSPETVGKMMYSLYLHILEKKTHV